MNKPYPCIWLFRNGSFQAGCQWLVLNCVESFELRQKISSFITVFDSFQIRPDEDIVLLSLSFHVFAF